MRMMQSRRIIWTGCVARMMDKRNAYRVLVRKRERNKPQEIPMRRWEDTTEMDFREIGWGGMAWINLA
jgi:hypothetical protein